MDQSQIERIVHHVLAEELGEKNPNTEASNSEISPILKEIRSSVQEKISNNTSKNSSSLLENIKNDVEKSMN